MVKNLPAMQEMWIQSLGWEDPLEKAMATHSSILAWRIPRTEEPGRYSPWGHKESDTTEWLLSLDADITLFNFNETNDTVPNLCFDLLFLNFMMVWKQYKFSRKHTLNSEFWSFLGLVVCSTIVSCDKGSGSEPHLPIKYAVTGVKNWYTYNHSVPRQPFWFSSLAWHSINHMRYTILYYKFGFVLGDFAKL